MIGITLLKKRLKGVIVHKASKKAFYQGFRQAFTFAPSRKKRIAVVVRDRAVVKVGGDVKRSGFEEDRANLALDWERVSGDMQAAVKYYESGKPDKSSN